MIDADGRTLRLADEPDSVADYIDAVAMQLRELHARGYRPSRLRVGTTLLTCIIEAKRSEVDRGLPVFILGLELERCDL